MNHHLQTPPGARSPNRSGGLLNGAPADCKALAKSASKTICYDGHPGAGLVIEVKMRFK
jgi:hypothetical protein